MTKCLKSLECYFGVYFPCCFATWETNTKITVSQVNTWFATPVHTLFPIHYSDVIMGAMTSQITSLTIVYTTVYSDADQRKHQSSVSLAFVRGIHRGRVNSPHKWPVTWKMFPFHDVIMYIEQYWKITKPNKAHIQGNAFENVIWKMEPFMFQPRCVDICAILLYFSFLVVVTLSFYQIHVSYS